MRQAQHVFVPACCSGNILDAAGDLANEPSAGLSFMMYSFWAR